MVRTAAVFVKCPLADGAISGQRYLLTVVVILYLVFFAVNLLAVVISRCLRIGENSLQSPS